MMVFLAVASLLAVVAAGLSPITRQGKHLMLDGQVWRAAGGNIYWAGLDENAEWSNETSHVGYPTPFCVEEAFATAARMGATIVRCHTCGISVGNALSFETALGVFNSTAAQHIDVAVAAAKKHGIRLIVPLIDNWHYYHGGKHTFTDWLGLSDENEFYTNPKAVAAFKDYISHLLNHTSTVTGLRYGDDPTVAIWETGNELHFNNGPPPLNWTADIAAHLKALSPTHLVMDGTEGLNVPALAIPDVDVYSLHMYPGPNTDEAIVQAAQAAAASKAFLVGEFGWRTSSLDIFLTAALADSNISADLYWSLFPHRNDHGYVQHGDSYTLHYPEGDGAAAAVEALRMHAWAMQGVSPAPPYAAPPAPEMTMVDSTNGLAWRGAAGADKYVVQASKDGGKTWQTVCDKCADDNGTPIAMPQGYNQADSFRAAGVTADGSTQGPWSTPATNASRSPEPPHP